MADKFYAVAKGWQTGVFLDSAGYLGAVHGFPGARAKSFGTEAEAADWLERELAPCPSVEATGQGDGQQEDETQVESRRERLRREFPSRVGAKLEEASDAHGAFTIGSLTRFDMARFSGSGREKPKAERLRRAAQVVRHLPLKCSPDAYLFCAALSVLAAGPGEEEHSLLQRGLRSFLEQLRVLPKMGRGSVRFDLHKHLGQSKLLVVKVAAFTFQFVFEGTRREDFAAVQGHPARRHLPPMKYSPLGRPWALFRSADFAAEYFSSESYNMLRQGLEELKPKKDDGAAKAEEKPGADAAAAAGEEAKPIEPEQSVKAPPKAPHAEKTRTEADEEPEGKAAEKPLPQTEDEPPPKATEEPSRLPDVEVAAEGLNESPTEAAAPDKPQVFRGIQFDKRFFRRLPEAYQARFVRTFRARLAKLAQVFSGDVSAAGNDMKLVRLAHQPRVFKRRVGDRRLAMVFQGGVLTLMKFSSHDRQMQDIRKIKGRSIGYVYYDMKDFLRQLDGWQGRGSLAACLDSPQHYVYDADQRSIIEAGEESENISVVGHAGAGKSIVGLKWLEDELAAGRDCLYLTMSPNLVYTLAYEFEKAGHAKASVRVSTTFDFLREALLGACGKARGKKLLTSGRSWEVFGRFWRENIDWTTFWDRHDPSFALHSDATTMQLVWRELHGLLKGAVPLALDCRHLAGIAEVLPAADYEELLRREKKAGVHGLIWREALYETYEKYKANLKKHGILDDNDIARLLLQGARPGKKRNKNLSVFLDECQDLTQVELMAILYLLTGSRVKRLASDRCQMVQPTYFSERWLRTMSNDYDRAQGRKIELCGLKPHYLHYNYRSSRAVIKFQNYILQYFRESDLLTLKLAELSEIKSPPLAPYGLRPVWVKATRENKEALVGELWESADRSDLQAIFAQEGTPSARSFKWGKDERPLDIITCKGMEYPSVLLYNVLTDMAFDPVMAWKYFYVGATRSNSCLIIFEESATGGQVADFLTEAYRRGLIEKCEDMRELRFGRPWLEYLRECLQDSVSENHLELAENAMNYGQYELALRVFARYGEDEHLTTYCRGKVLEERGDYRGALALYESLPRDWQSRGRTRMNSVSELLNQELLPEDFLKAFLISERGGEDFLPAARAAWEEKYGRAGGFYESLAALSEENEYTRESLGHWLALRGERLRAATRRVMATARGEK